tara:strand:+ start:3628 stop:4473 length:846 start_codon:yes stop_codon:yes gene_type:complete
MSYILFDIGGTNTRVAASEDLKTFSEPIKFKTPNDFDLGVEKIVEAVRKLTDGDIRGVAGDIRGVLNEDKTEMLVDAGNVLTDWEEKPLVAELKKTFEAPVYLENDAALVGLGEATYGAGKGDDIVVYLTVSSGVGGAKIEMGEIDKASYGFEPGHQILDIDHTILGEEEEPTLEKLVSGLAVEDRMGCKPYEISQNDAVWDQLAFYLAHGIRNTILYWSPDTLVLGGSMIVGDPRILLADIKKHTEEIMADLMPVPNIVDASLGDDGGLYGAMAILGKFS